MLSVVLHVNHISPLLILQGIIIRIHSCNVSRLVNTEFLLKEQEMLTFGVLHKYQVAQFMFNFIKGVTPEVVIDMLVYNSDNHQYNTRHLHLLHIPAVNSSMGKNKSTIWRSCHMDWTADLYKYRIFIVFIQKTTEIDVSEIIYIEYLFCCGYIIINPIDVLIFFWRNMKNISYCLILFPCFALSMCTLSLQIPLSPSLYMLISYNPNYIVQYKVLFVVLHLIYLCFILLWSCENIYGLACLFRILHACFTALGVIAKWNGLLCKCGHCLSCKLPQIWCSDFQVTMYALMNILNWLL